jgi:hypothetical protein
MPIKDSLIAATALVYGLVVAASSRTEFERAGVKIINPFRSSEPIGRAMLFVSLPAFRSRSEIVPRRRSH